MTLDPLSALAEHPVFQHLDRQGQTLVAASGKVIPFRPGRPLPTRDACVLLLEGAVRSRIQSGDAELLAGVHGAPFWWGDEELLSGAATCQTFRTLEPCTVWMIPASTFLPLVQTQPALVRLIAQNLALRLTEQSRRRLEGARLNLAQRLERAMVDYARAVGDWTPQGLRLRVAVHHRELAVDVGATRESVGRALSVFIREGRLFRQNSRFVVPMLEHTPMECSVEL